MPGLSLHDRCRNIDLLVMDVDGVLTDGSIIYTNRGAEVKAFHVRDGSGIKVWLGAGKRAAILTGRQSEIVARRGAELGVTRVIQGADDKRTAFRALLKELDIALEHAAYIGDDLPDLPVLRHCGFAVTVADACAEARAAAHFVTALPGGRGAVRETIELILTSQGRWQEAAQHFDPEASART